MSLEKEDARATLRAHGLRVTAPRVAVLRALADADRPLSHSELLELMGETDWDPATTYRNLVKLRDAGIAVIATRAKGIDRYMFAAAHGSDHHHPHFVCNDCGRVACLPDTITVSAPADDSWAQSIASANIQLRGACPDCLKRS